MTVLFSLFGVKVWFKDVYTGDKLTRDELMLVNFM